MHDDFGAINTVQVKRKISVFTYKLPDHENLNRQLLTLIKQYREKYPEKEEHTNLRAWRSDYESHIKEDRFDYLIQKVCEVASLITKHHEDYKAEVDYLPSGFWVGQYDKGNYARKHHHAPNDFACVYYVDVDEDSAPIIFEDDLIVKPENGMIVIFPGFLNHRVAHTQSPRTIAAMNLIKRRKDQSKKMVGVSYV